MAKSPQTGPARKQQKSPSPVKPRKTATARDRGKAAAPIKQLEAEEDTPAQASEEEHDSDMGDLEEVTALTLTKPGGRKRRSPVAKRPTPAAAQKPKSKRAKIMPQGDSPNLESAQSNEKDERSNEEDSKGKTAASGRVQASPLGGVSTRRRGGRKRKVQEREEKDEEEMGKTMEATEMKEDHVRQDVSTRVVVVCRGGSTYVRTCGQVGRNYCTCMACIYRLGSGNLC